MKKLIVVLIVFVVIVIAFQQGASYFMKKAEDKRAAAPVIITGSYSAEEAADSGSKAYRQIMWDELMPADWTPSKSTKDLNIDELEDNDPRAIEGLKKTMEEWKKAPVNSKIDGSSISIAGFIVSLERDGTTLKEFLLVPYYGACIHTPPPPPNQIIHVVLSKPIKNVKSLDAVWVDGRITVQEKETAMGTAGYMLKGEDLKVYVPESRPKETHP